MTTMQIDLTPARFDQGPALERVAFGKLELTAAGHLLTAAIRVDDDDARHYDSGPYISGYHLAEWLVWNWWRLRWEPRLAPGSPAGFEWNLAHCLPAAGEGYHWPDITIWSDGFQSSLTSTGSDQSDTPLFYYLGALEGRPITVPTVDFESAVDRFVDAVLQRCHDANLSDTNLHTLWNDLQQERNDPEIGRFRRLEALLGFDPDEKGDEYISNLLKNADLVGENALSELATGAAHNMLSAHQIAAATKSAGNDLNPDDAFRLAAPVTMPWGQTPAWRIGAATAKAVRQQAGLAAQPVTDHMLTCLGGMDDATVASDRSSDSLSWVFHLPPNRPRVVLRPRQHTGRRFDVARLIGDRLFSDSGFTARENLSPATRSYTYRQKAQRAFAAELLSPWETVRAMLANDRSAENQEQIAEHFAVSPLTIHTLLMNHEGYAPGFYG